MHLPSEDVLDLLARLVDKSLVVLDERETGARYHMLETIRQYAGERLLDSGEAAALRDRHLDAMLAFGEAAASHFFSPKVNEWTRRLQEERDNTRVALEWALAQRPEAAVRLAGDLSYGWALSSYASEGVRVLRQGLEQTAALPPVEGEAARARQMVIARATSGLAGLLLQLGEMSEARRYAEQVLPIWRASGTQPELGIMLLVLGASASILGDAPTALAASREAIAMLRSLSNPWLLAQGLAFRASISGSIEHDIAAARTQLEESIAIYRRLGDTYSAATPLWVLGDLEYAAGNYAQARDAYEASLQAGRASGNRVQTNSSRSGLASAEWRLGHYEAALAGYCEVIAEWQRIGNRGGIARCLECVAFVWIQQAAAEPSPEMLLLRAARLLGAAEQQREAAQSTMSPIEQSEYQDQVAQLHGRLDDARCKAEWAAGRALSLEQAIAIAQG